MSVLKKLREKAQRIEEALDKENYEIVEKQLNRVRRYCFFLEDKGVNWFYHNLNVARHFVNYYEKKLDEKKKDEEREKLLKGLQLYEISRSKRAYYSFKGA